MDEVLRQRVAHVLHELWVETITDVFDRMDLATEDGKAYGKLDARYLSYWSLLAKLPYEGLNEQNQAEILGWADRVLAVVEVEQGED